ncbi:hypothetical protein E8E11_007616 [Didymella keratinophila]|nr:hypothetical protein E8E11_007616 [Didymella keratinophila]
MLNECLTDLKIKETEAGAIKDLGKSLQTKLDQAQIDLELEQAHSKRELACKDEQLLQQLAQSQFHIDTSNELAAQLIKQQKEVTEGLASLVADHERELRAKDQDIEGLQDQLEKQEFVEGMMKVELECKITDLEADLRHLKQDIEGKASAYAAELQQQFEERFNDDSQKCRMRITDLEAENQKLYAQLSIEDDLEEDDLSSGEDDKDGIAPVKRAGIMQTTLAAVHDSSQLRRRIGVNTNKRVCDFQHDVMARTRAVDDGATKRRGRPPGSRNSGVSKSRVAKPVAAPKSGKASSKNKPDKKSRRNDEEDELSTVAPIQERPPQSSQPRKRRANAEVDEIAEEPTKSQKNYVQLEQKTKRIPQDVIETWPHLPQNVLEQITTVIKDAKKDIANTQRDERRVMAAHNSLNPLVKRLVRQLSASRIPPQARDLHFNIDKLTERNGQVFREVTTARHSKQLLSEQVRVMQNLLAKDEKNLDELKNDSRNWKAEWKHQQRQGRASIAR